MLRIGLLLLLISTIGVGLRTFEIINFSEDLFKWVCSGTLFVSLACFLGTYCSLELAPHKTLTHK